jgi:hypothetical protein
MKKGILFITTATILATSLSSIASAVDTVDVALVNGDANLNGSVESEDYNRIMQIYAYTLLGTGKLNPTAAEEKEYVLENFNLSSEQYDAIDVNSDGFVDSHDAMITFKYLIAVKDGYTAELVEDKVIEYYENISSENVQKYTSEILTEQENNLETWNKNFYSTYPKFDTSEKNQKPHKIVGDVNGDDVFDEKDIELMDKYEIGDANNDGKIDSRDAVLTLQNYASELVGNATEKSIYFQDVNGDGKVNSIDATVILRTYANNLISK